MVSTSLKGENINLWRIFKLIKIIIMRHYSTNLFKPIMDYLTNERLKLQFCKESHLNSTRMRRFIEEKSKRNMLTRILVTLTLMMSRKQWLRMAMGFYDQMQIIGAKYNQQFSKKIKHEKRGKQN